MPAKQGLGVQSRRRLPAFSEALIRSPAHKSCGSIKKYNNRPPPSPPTTTHTFAQIAHSKTQSAERYTWSHCADLAASRSLCQRSRSHTPTLSTECSASLSELRNYPLYLTIYSRGADNIVFTVRQSANISIYYIQLYSYITLSGSIAVGRVPRFPSAQVILWQLALSQSTLRIYKGRFIRMEHDDIHNS